MLRNILLITLLSFSLSVYPIAVFHGITGSCEIKDTKNLVNGLKTALNVHVECIEIGNGVLDSVIMPLKKQAEKACENLNTNRNFQSKFSIVGISQGTLIGRHVIEKCKLNGQVMRYLSFDGPQMGIAAIPKMRCGAFCDWIIKLTEPAFYALQDSIAPAAYFRYRYDQAYYNQHNKFLKMLNNENEPRDPEIYRRITSLEKMKLIKSKSDSIITPRESSWFEFYDGTGAEIIPLEQSDFYIKDYIGLRKLNEENKLFFTELREDHIQYTHEEFTKEIVSFFHDDPNVIPKDPIKKTNTPKN